MQEKNMRGLLLPLALGLLCMHNTMRSTYNIWLNNELLSDQDHTFIAQIKDAELVYIPDAVKNAIRQLHTTYSDLGGSIDLTLFLDTKTHIAPYAMVRKDMHMLLQRLIFANIKARDPQDHAVDIIQDYVMNLDTKKISLELDDATMKKSQAADTRAAQLFNTNNGLAINAGGILNIYGGTNTTTSSTGSTITINTISDPTFTGGITATGGSITLNSGTNALNISTDVAATTVDIGTGAAAKTVNVGSTTGASALAITAGSGGIALNGTSAVNISTDSTTTTVQVGTGSAAKTVDVGSTTGASAVAITAGSGGIALNGTSTASISTDSTNATISIGTGAAIKTVDIGSVSGSSAISIIGTATATTQAANDDSTNLATTAYADNSNPYRLLSTQVVSAATSVQFVNLPSTYTSFQVKWYNVSPGTVNNSIQLQFSTVAGGGSYITTGYYGANIYGVSSGSTATNINDTSNGSSLQLSQVLYNSAGSGPLYVCSGELNVTNIGASTALYPGAYGRVVCLQSTTPVVSVSSNGGYVTTLNCRSFQLLMSFGTISGTFKLYGVL